jgi:3-hydroxy-9,10-secoandrosta-1,3,5(10)-triene-9,17-dione monooxygenase
MRGVDMTRDVLEGIDEQADRLRALGPVNEALGQLDDRSADALRQSGVMHMLQPEEFGGIATHPADFADAVYEIARLDGSAGWVAGSVGVPPWIVATADRRPRDEVWEADPDSWIASAYSLAGVLLPVDGGYRLSGEWRFVAGVDHCHWAVLGARVVDTASAIGPVSGHVYALAPTADLRILEDSWDGVGLAGTGGKSIAADDIFVPAHRVLGHRGIADGTAAEQAGLRNPIYHLPFGMVVPLGITAAVIGMADGALAHHLAAGGSDDVVVEQAAAEIRASRLALLDTVSASFHRVLDGPIDVGLRERARRDQVAAARRAVRAVDDIVSRSSVDALRRDHPLQRFWRDAHVGLAGVVAVSGLIG